MIACSRMYNIAPQAREAWDQIFSWAAETSGVPLEIIPHAAPAPLEELWARDDMGCVFMCGWPFATANVQAQIIVAPVPSPARYDGKPIYFTDLVVLADSSHRSLEDTFGGRVAWTIETSHSGFNALRYHLLGYRSQVRPTLYEESIGPLVSPIRALQSVIDGEADVAPLDNLCLDLLRRHTPERVDGLRVIATTEAAAMPPLVASPGADPDACARLAEALLRAREDRRLHAALDDALVARFVSVASTDYDETAGRARRAVNAGYPMPA